MTRNLLKRNLLAVVCLLAATMAPHAQVEAVLGFWSTEDNDAVVELFSCSSGLCGRIVGLKEPFDAEGSPLRDSANPVEALRARPICGLEILSGLKLKRQNTFDNGSIYNPENGKTYSAQLALQGEALEVTGYIGVSLLGDQQTWTRASGAFKRCDGTKQKGAR